MVQKTQPWGVLWVLSSRLMWADKLKKKLTAFHPYIKKFMIKITVFDV